MQREALTLYSIVVAVVITIIIFGSSFSWAPSFNKINGIRAGELSWLRARDWPNTPQDGLVNLSATPTLSVQEKRVVRSGFGYLLALQYVYVDQLTAAPPNIASLMCVAGEWGGLSCGAFSGSS